MATLATSNKLPNTNAMKTHAISKVEDLAAVCVWTFAFCISIPPTQILKHIVGVLVCRLRNIRLGLQ